MSLPALIELPFGLPGRIYRGRMPFSAKDPDGEIFPRMQELGISVIVLLVGRDEFMERTGRDLLAFYTEHGLEVLHLPIPDFSVPELTALDELVRAVIERAQAGKHIAVHCFAGYGRTGMFLACLARRVRGMSADEAISWVREYVPGSIEVDEQIEVVKRFSTHTFSPTPLHYWIAHPTKPEYQTQWLGFVDESGSIRMGQGHNLLVLASILVQDARPLDLIVKRTRQTFHTLAHHDELKFSHTSDKVIQTVIKALAVTPVEIYAVVLDKSAILKPPKDFEMFYRVALAELVTDILKEHPNLLLTWDKRYTKQSLFDSLEQYVRYHLQQPNIPATFLFRKEDSTASRPLQLADFVAGSIARKFNSGDETYFNLLSPKIKSLRVIAQAFW